jgi:hypothetical protein
MPSGICVSLDRGLVLERDLAIGKRGIPICYMTVYRILRSSGPNGPLQKPRVKRTHARWQRKYSNRFWQCGLKIVEARWLMTILDDPSRRLLQRCAKCPAIIQLAFVGSVKLRSSYLTFVLSRLGS